MKFDELYDEVLKEKQNLEEVVTEGLWSRIKAGTGGLVTGAKGMASNLKQNLGNVSMGRSTTSGVDVSSQMSQRKAEIISKTLQTKMLNKLDEMENDFVKSLGSDWSQKFPNLQKIIASIKKSSNDLVNPQNFIRTVATQTTPAANTVATAAPTPPAIPAARSKSKAKPRTRTTPTTATTSSSNKNKRNVKTKPQQTP